MLIDLLLLVAAVAIVVWLLGLLPLPAPFQQIITTLGVIIVVIAVLQTLLGVDLVGHFHSRWGN